MKTKLYITLGLLFMAATAFGADILGPNPVNQNDTHTYTYNEGGLILAPNWVASGGTVQSSSVSGTTYSVTINWTNSGTGSITLKMGSLIRATRSVTVNPPPPPLSAGTIGGSNTICFNESSGSLTNSSYASGGTGAYTYTWQKKHPLTGVWENTSGTNAASYSPGNLTSTTDFRRRVTDGSTTKYSNVVTVTVHNYLSAGGINGSQTICYSGDPSTLGSTAGATGGSGGYSYQWQYSTNGSSFTNIGGATGTTYNPGPLTTTHWYRRRVKSNSCSDYSYTGNIIVTVHANLNAGAINNAQTLCYNGNPTTLGSSAGASGGSGGYTYQWQSSFDGSNFINISGATNTSYDPGTLTSSRWFRRRVISNNCTGYKYTSSVKITIHADLNAGIINNAQTICYNEDPNTLGSIADATGGSGGYSYQWQSSTNGSSFTDISGATGTTYNPGQLTSTRWYRRRVKANSCLGYKYSNPIQVTVHGNLYSGGINNAQTICYNADPSVLGSTSGASGGGGNYSYQWQSSTNGSYFTNISGATGTTYDPGPLTSTRWYRRRVNSNNCSGYAYTSDVKVTVHSDLNPGSISNAQSFCYSGDPATLTSTSPGGGDGNYSYQWHWRVYNGSWSGWTNISGATSATYDPPPANFTTEYRRGVTSCGVSKNSNVIRVTVYQLPILYSVTGGGGYCPEGNGVNVGLSGSHASYTYQLKRDGTDVGSPLTGTGSALDFGHQTATGSYTIVATIIGTSCARIMHGSATVSVYQNLNAGSINNAQTICYGGDPGALGSSSGASGGSGGYTYQWQSSTDGDSFSDISGASGITYDPGPLTSTRWYQRRVNSNNCSGYAYTSNIKITVYSDLNPGSISADQTICYGEDPANLSGTSPSGNNGSYTYQWQWRVYNGSWSGWTNIGGATSASYDPDPPNFTTEYRRKVTSCGRIKYTNAVRVSVHQLPILYSVTGGGGYCSGGSGVNVGLSGSESWANYQLKRNGTNVGSPVAGTGGALSFGNQTTAGNYTVSATINGTTCSRDMQGSAGVVVKTYPNSYSMTGGGNYCSGGSGVMIGLSGSESGTSYQLKQGSTNIGSAVSGTNGAISFGNQTIVGSYSVVASRNGCSTTISGVSVSTYTNIVAGTISGAQTICEGGNPSALTGTNPTNGDGSYTHQWQSREYNGSWSNWGDIIGATSASYDPGVLNLTTQFKRGDTSCGQTNYSNSIEVTINQLPGLAVGYSQIRCGDGTVNLTAVPGINADGVKWYSTASGGLVLHTGNSFTTPSLMSNTTYYAASYSTSTNCVDTDRVPVVAYINSEPTSFNITGGGSYCTGGFGVAIGLSNRESGVTYKLKRDGVEVSAVSQNEGNGLTFGYHTIAGVYTIEGTNSTTGCAKTMSGSATLSIDPLPTVTAGDDFDTFHSSGSISLTGQTPGGTWVSTLVTGNNFQTNTAGVGSHAITYTYTEGSTSCSNTDIRTITVVTDPQITLNGSANMGMGETRILDATAGYSTYQWKRNGTNIQGANSTSYSATQPGQYSVQITNAYGQTVITQMVEIFDAFTTQNKNFVQVSTLQIPYLESNTTPISELNKESVGVSINYIDGLGRAQQTVTWQATPAGKDLVQHVEYDAFGRTTKAYLPYESAETGATFKQNSSTEQFDFFQGPTPKVAVDTRPFSESIYEVSPLNRVAKQFGAGQAWWDNDKSVQHKYELNLTSDVVRVWDIANGLPVSSTTYVEGQLRKNITIDEDGHSIEEYTDKQGRVVLKKVETGEQVDPWAQTYYTYDDLGNLRFVFPPMMVKEMTDANDFTPDTDILDRWAFQYKFDGRKRMIEKKVPGSGWVYMVYDKRDRLVLTQDANQRASHEWTFTKYDHLDRPISTGIYPHGSTASRSTMQMMVNRGWNHTNGVILKGAFIEKTSVDSWSNAGASTLSIIGDSQDGAVSVEATETDKARMFGLAKADVDDSYLGIDYAIYMRHEHILKVYESGVNKGTFGFYSTGDILSVERVGSTIYYKKNGGTFYTSSVASTEALLIDLSIYHQGGTIKFIPPTMSESRNNDAGNVHGYTNNTFPKVSDPSAYLTVTYYDDYSFPHAFGYSYLDVLNIGPHFTKVRGQVTGGKVKNLKNNEWLDAISYYDDRYRVIQTQANNTLGGTDVISNKYDFVGKIIESLATHNDGTNDTVIKRTFTYDHAGRLLSIDHSINGAADVTIVENEYNAIGELVDKKLHSSDDGSTFIQSIDYRYNIRGWLASINSTGLKVVPGVNDEDNDFFGAALIYKQSIPTFGITGAWNGNIAAILWSDFQQGDNIKKRAYAYDYDAMNRLKGAKLMEKPTNSGWKITNNNRVNNIGYDLNGNITALTRHDGTGTVMDDMTYGYGATKSNQLHMVSDASGSADGFKDGDTGTDQEYFYDANGNMIKDDNKGIENIEYNQLNLPVKVDMGGGDYIEYAYDAAGIKLQQKVYEGNTLTKTTDYVGEYIYENGSLQLIQHEEGRIVPESNGAMTYQYHMKDHLGNVRLTFTSGKYTSSYLATMEDAAHASESQDFNNLDDRVPYPVGGKAVRLNRSNPFGPSIGLSVARGDTIAMSVKAYYEDASGFGNSSLGLTQMTALIAGSFGTGGLGTEAQSVYDAFNTGSGPIALLGGGTGDDAIPSAYLNYLLFNMNDSLISSGFFNVQSGPNLVQTIDVSNLIIGQAGYIFIYLTNESDSDNPVYFDDFSVTVGESPVLETTDYYPFGLAFNRYEKAGMIGQRYKFNGIERISDLDLSWDLAVFRSYDPLLARWHQVDPKAEKYYSWGGYHAMGNNPIRIADPLGDEWKTEEDKEKANQINEGLAKRQGKLEKKETKLQSQIDKANDNGKTDLANKLTSKKEDVTAMKEDVIAAQSEITAIGKDTEMKFTFNKLGEGAKEGFVSGDTDGTVVINYAGGDGNAIHELKHAHQVLKGQLEVTAGSEVVKYPRLTPINSEIEAYKRQFAAGYSLPPSDTRRTPTQYKRVSGEYIRGIYYKGENDQKVKPYSTSLHY